MHCKSRFFNKQNGRRPLALLTSETSQKPECQMKHLLTFELWHGRKSKLNEFKQVSRRARYTGPLLHHEGIWFLVNYVSLKLRFLTGQLQYVH